MLLKDRALNLHKNRLLLRYCAAFKINLKITLIRPASFNVTFAGPAYYVIKVIGVSRPPPEKAARPLNNGAGE